MKILARDVHVQPQPNNRRQVTYIDLVQLTGDRYALMDGFHGRVLEELTEADALARLRAWRDDVRPVQGHDRGTLGIVCLSHPLAADPTQSGVDATDRATLSRGERDRGAAEAASATSATLEGGGFFSDGNRQEKSGFLRRAEDRALGSRTL
jgi:hypothetical protein